MAPLIPLEDSWNDVIRKARRGLSISEAELAQQSGVRLEKVISLEKGFLELKELEQLGAALGLNVGNLIALARNEYHPGMLVLPKGLVMFTTPWSDFEVHAYLLWDEASKQSVAFDTGSDVSKMLEFLKLHDLTLTQILLTHGHGDHVFELDRLIEKTGSTAWIGERENIPGAKNFTAGREFSLACYQIETRSTWGHAVGGISYIIHGLDRPVAIVGDALFAGSMGGPMISYAACLETNRKELLSLPGETVVCPGHGPLTTVDQEKVHNPFFS